MLTSRKLCRQFSVPRNMYSQDKLTSLNVTPAESLNSYSWQFTVPESICYSAPLPYITLYKYVNVLILVILFVVPTLNHIQNCREKFWLRQLWNNITMCSGKLLLLIIQGELSRMYLEKVLILYPRELSKVWLTVINLNSSKFQIITGYVEGEVIICAMTKFWNLSFVTTFM